MELYPFSNALHYVLVISQHAQAWYVLLRVDICQGYPQNIQVVCDVMFIPIDHLLHSSNLYNIPVFRIL